MMRRSLIALAIFATSTTTARAETRYVLGPPPTTIDESYGVEIVFADIGGIVGAIATAPKRGTDSTPTRSVIRYGFYVAPSPIIHALHGNWGRAGISFALHMGGALAADGMLSGNLHAETAGILFAFLIGGATAITALDASRIAHVEKPNPAAWQPTVAAGPHAVQLGFARSF